MANRFLCKTVGKTVWRRLGQFRRSWESNQEHFEKTIWSIPPQLGIEPGTF
jgi:hypothetical protein